MLHEPFLDRAAAHPERPAVLTATREVSYGELAARADAVRHRVADATRGEELRDRLVGITLDKGPEQVAAAYGVMMAGAAYLPVGTALPAHRRTRILRDGAAAGIVTDSALDAALEWPDGIARVLADRAPHPPGADGADRRPPGPARPGDLAYVLYTSGSTGSPKGVMIEHGAVLNTVADINDRFGVGPDDRVFGLADLGFDLSVYDVFGTHAAGAALVLPDPDMRSEPAHWAKVMTQHGVTVWNSVPAQMQMLVEHLEAGGEVPERLRLVLLSGDWIPVDLPRRIHDLWPDADVVSLGGATEASIWSIHHRVDEVPRGARSVPYGVPLRNQTFHVLDERMEPCPVWTAGQLYIGGTGLARGYWGDEERTAASFVRHPRTGERLYRTGDFGRYTADGTIEFLGRRDGQVKINGHRVELGEIETTLSRHPGVDASVVVRTTDGAGAARLHGYVVPSPRDETLFVTERAEPGTGGGRSARPPAGPPRAPDPRRCAPPGTC
ncbi:amino acid adenylation domain-containing protein [Streptomyces lavendulocolor]|uniref:amino acid adenylation domain-containing protein n=1 Tax=Streptomyces lavendulocolor TaxID=67316 RepID=UPI003C2E7BF0